MLMEMEPAAIALWGGLALGIVFGVTVVLTNFCTMGGVSDAVLMGNGARLRAWVLAATVAIIGTQGLAWAGIIDLSQSIYLTPNLGWLGAVLGGLMFGYGTTRSSGCASKNLVRIGSGNLKSLVVVVVMAITAYMTLRGLLGPVRLQLETTNIALDASGFASQSIADILSGVTGIAAESMRLVVAAVAVVFLLWFCFKNAEFRASGRDMAGGLVLGLCVIGGWYINGVLAYDEFEPAPPGSITFVGPAAETLQYLMTWTGSTANFAIASVFGVILGSFVISLLTGRFRLEGFVNKEDTLSNLGGAVLMGFGGVTALGCTVGQGMTGISTLALGSLIAWVSILLGIYFGIKHLEEGSFSGAIKASLSRA